MFICSDWSLQIPCVSSSRSPIMGPLATLKANSDHYSRTCKSAWVRDSSSKDGGIAVSHLASEVIGRWALKCSSFSLQFWIVAPQVTIQGALWWSCCKQIVYQFLTLVTLTCTGLGCYWAFKSCSASSWQMSNCSIHSWRTQWACIPVCAQWSYKCGLRFPVTGHPLLPRSCNS